MMNVWILVFSYWIVSLCSAFVPRANIASSIRRPTTVVLQASPKKRSVKTNSGGSSGKGFANSGRSYGKSARASFTDVVDIQAGMENFFEANSEWHPLFRSMVSDASVPAMDLLGGAHGEKIDFHETSSPWRRLPTMPILEDDKQIIASFLDNMQQSLVDIPVDEQSTNDSSDTEFLEEGRRILVCSRFQVLQGVHGGSTECYESLFSTCWNELAALSYAGEPDTGSLIFLPEYDLGDLRRFTDVNVHRPLKWLGMDSTFEVASFSRGTPVVRLIHKLSDIPTESYSSSMPYA